MVDKWIDRPDIDDVDFSSLKVAGLAGGYTSPEKLRKYKAFFKEHGFKYDLMSGYGMSEAGFVQYVKPGVSRSTTAVSDLAEDIPAAHDAGAR